MRYEGDVNHASDPYGTPPQRGGRRGLLGLGLAVVGIVAFAGAIVVVYGGKGQSTPDGGPPLLMADSAPTKARPEQPGGMEVPHQDKLVYERLNDRGSKSQIERLLPPPEEPLPRPVVAPQVPPSPTLPEAPAVAQLPPPPPGSTTTVPRQDGEAAPPPRPGAAPWWWSPA
ncbi:SPOR domain-containing protein, partial [Azospirillum formosense]|nr:SPOR domain-containing protein [Azospirillum formosense]